MNPKCTVAKYASGTTGSLSRDHEHARYSGVLVATERASLLSDVNWVPCKLNVRYIFVFPTDAVLIFESVNEDMAII